MARQKVNDVKRHYAFVSGRDLDIADVVIIESMKDGHELTLKTGEIVIIKGDIDFIRVTPGASPMP